MVTKTLSLMLLALSSTITVCSAAPQASKILIGFRGVPKADAEQYNKDKTIKPKPGGNSGQIGQGIYLSQGPRDLPGPYLCSVYADSSKFKSAQKLWIPEKSEVDQTTLWYNDANIDAYINHYKQSPASTIRFSPISETPSAIQMVIPPSLLGSAPLGISAICEPAPSDPNKFPKGLSYPDMSGEWAINGIKP